MKIMILKDVERFNLIAGDVYSAKRYKFDPEKYELGERVSDGFKPECNEYIYNVATEILGKWHKVVDNAFIPLKDCEIPPKGKE